MQFDLDVLLEDPELSELAANYPRGVCFLADQILVVRRIIQIFSAELRDRGCSLKLRLEPIYVPAVEGHQRPPKKPTVLIVHDNSCRWKVSLTLGEMYLLAGSEGGFCATARDDGVRRVAVTLIEAIKKVLDASSAKRNEAPRAAKMTPHV